MFIIWLFVVLLLEFGQIHFVSSQDEDPIVETNYGLLRGFADQDRFSKWGLDTREHIHACFQTDRQTDREAGRQRGRQTDKQVV